MSKFAVNFIVDTRYLGDVMAALQPYKVEDLGFKLVAGSAPNLRPDGTNAWQVAAAAASATPQPMVYFRKLLMDKGFKEGTVYNAMSNAVTNKAVVRKMVNGKPHYIKGAKA